MMLGIFPMLMHATAYKEPEKISLDKGWEFAQVGKGEWLPATVPGTVHQDLMDNDKLINPFFGMNEEKVQWVEKEDWQYRTTFTLTKEQLQRQVAVLNFEGERHLSYRMLRAVKNRYGSTNEIGMFEMTGGGLLEVPNPSAALLAGRPADANGSCVVAAMEGTRPLLTEVQGLVTKSAYGSARRTAAGIDHSRAVLLMAILEKRAGFLLGAYDAYVNVVGGMNLDEPAVDLAVVLAIASSYLERPIPLQLAAFGEVGLAGEVRAVSGAEQRIAELERLGFDACLLPADCMNQMESKRTAMRLIPVRNIQEAIRAALSADSEK